MLVGSAPSFDARVPKSRTSRKTGQSGRLHRTDAGEWVWSSDENESESDDDESESVSDDDQVNFFSLTR